MDNALMEFDITELEEGESRFVKVFQSGHSRDDIDIYNGMQSPSKALSEHVGDEIEMQGFTCELVYIEDTRTKKVIPAPRIVIFASNGETYGSVSKTLFSSLKKLMSCLGDAEKWPANGLPVKIRQMSKGEKRYLSLEILRK